MKKDSVSPTARQIVATLERLADRLQKDADVYMDGLDEHFTHTIRQTTTSLERLVPGLTRPPDNRLFLQAEKEAKAALGQGYALAAIIAALRGLAGSPHAPQLWYLIAAGCFELEAVEDCIRCLYHTLWINPGHRLARADLEALTAFLDEDDEERGE